MTSGNVSGARMDLETYVQRYYLGEDPLCGEPTFSGDVCRQFELRMYDLEKAGEGKTAVWI